MCVCTYIHIYTYICTSLSLSLSLSVFWYVRVYIYIYINTFVLVCVCVYTSTCVWVYVCIIPKSCSSPVGPVLNEKKDLLRARDWQNLSKVSSTRLSRSKFRFKMTLENFYLQRLVDGIVVFARYWCAGALSVCFNLFPYICFQTIFLHSTGVQVVSLSVIRFDNTAP